MTQLLTLQGQAEIRGQGGSSTRARALQTLPGSDRAVRCCASRRAEEPVPAPHGGVSGAAAVVRTRGAQPGNAALPCLGITARPELSAAAAGRLGATARRQAEADALHGSTPWYCNYKIQ